MKKLNVITGLLLLLFILSYNLSYSAAIDTTGTKKENAPKPKQENPPKEEKGKTATDTSKATPKGYSDKRLLPVAPTITEPTLQIVSVLFFVVMLFLFYKIFVHLKNNHQFIGFQSIKLIGLILIFPGICIIALIGGGLIEGSTLAALLGTIAGYVLSTDDDSKNASLKDANSKLKNDKDALDQKIKDLNTEITQLRAQIPQQQ